MIDIDTEELMTLRDACKLPALRNKRTGNPAHFSQIHRWTTSGARDVDGNRVKLEFIQTPGGRCTSREAVARFIDALTNPDKPVAAPAWKKRKAEAAEQELVPAGFEVGGNE